MIAGLFPGQGIRAAEVASALPAGHPRLEQATQIVGFDIKRAVEQERRRASSSMPTSLSQPAILVAGVISFEDALARGETFDALLGHSLGEYTALVNGGAISFADGLRLVATRGRAMQRVAAATNGSMAAVTSLTREQIEVVCAQAGVEFANDNSPNQVVLSGELDRLAEAAEIVHALGGRSVLLPVNGAYHTNAMLPATIALRDALEQIEIRTPKVPVISNVSVARHRSPGEIRRLLVRQLTERVRFRECVTALAREGVSHFVDLGPGRIVGRLAEATIGATQEVA